jgi:hypothetical protein
MRGMSQQAFYTFYTLGARAKILRSAQTVLRSGSLAGVESPVTCVYCQLPKKCDHANEAPINNKNMASLFISLACLGFQGDVHFVRDSE